MVMKKERTHKKVLNMKVNRKCQRDQDKDGNDRLGKMLEGRPWEETEEEEEL
jgi:hypothetical protein